MNHRSIRTKTYTAFFIVNIFTALLAIIVLNFELSPITITQSGHIVVSIICLIYVSKIAKKRLFRNIVLLYYGSILLGIWTGLGTVHPMLIGYSIMLFQVILITAEENKRYLVVFSYVVIMIVLGIYDILFRPDAFVTVPVLTMDRLLSILSFFVGNLLILHYNKSVHDDAVKEISQLTYVDELTSFRNRHAFYHDMKMLEDEYHQYEEDYTVTYLDMNGLKGINDAYGHKAGDDAIITFGVTVRKQLRNNDRIYRMGGDEFVIITRHLDADLLVSKLEMAQTKLYERHDKPYKITFSYGWDLRSKNETSETLLKHADDNMYKMKHELKLKSEAEMIHIK